MTQYFHPIESGAEKTVRELSEELVKKRHKVDVVTVNKDNNLERVELKDGYRIIRLDRVFWIPGFLGLLKIINVMIQDLCYIIKMFSIIKKNKYDILICSGTETFSLASILMKKIYRIPVFVIWTGANFKPLKLLEKGGLSNSQKIYWRYNTFISKLSVLNSSIILLKAYDKMEFVRCFNINSKKVISITNPIKIPNLTASEAAIIPDIDKNMIAGRFIILFCNRLTYIKGVDLLPDIVRILKKSFSNFLLIICGTGNLPDKISCELFSDELKENICFLGFRRDIHQLMRLSDISLRTDRGETAGGKSITEAMVASKPVIVRKTKAQMRWFKHLEDIYFVDRGIPEDYADAILYLKNNKEKCSTIGENAKREVLKNWNMEIFTDQFIDIINSQITKK